MKKPASTAAVNSGMALWPVLAEASSTMSVSAKNAPSPAPMAT